MFKVHSTAGLFIWIRDVTNCVTNSLMLSAFVFKGIYLIAKAVAKTI